MYGMISEHYHKSFVPQRSSQASQCVGETGSCFARIPRQNSESFFRRRRFAKPQPHHRIQPQTHSRSPFGTFSRPRLQLMRAKILLGLFDGVLDCPSIGICSQHVGDFHIHIGREKVIVFFFSGRVAAEDQKHWRWSVLVPQHLPRIDQTCSLATSAGKFDFRPWADMRGQTLRLGQDFAAFSRTNFAGTFSLRRQIVKHRIAAHSRNDRCMEKICAGQRGIESIGHDAKFSRREPQSYFFDHFLGELNERFFLLAMQPHVDRQAERFSAPPPQGG